MCLIVSRNEQIKKAENDIIVYKIMLELSENEYVTPFRMMIVCKPIKGMIIKAEGDVCRTANYSGREDFYAIYGGMLHAFSTFDFAVCGARNSVYSLLKRTIWRMTIPKGTDYIEGKYSEIAAKEMVFEEMMPGKFANFYH